MPIVADACKSIFSRGRASEPLRNFFYVICKMYCYYYLANKHTNDRRWTSGIVLGTVVRIYTNTD